MNGSNDEWPPLKFCSPANDIDAWHRQRLIDALITTTDIYPNKKGRKNKQSKHFPKQEEKHTSINIQN